MKDFDPRDKIESARMDLVLSFPVYGTVFLRMNVHEDPTCKTAWTDGVSIGYNVDYTASLTHEEIIGLSKFCGPLTCSNEISMNG